MKMTYKETLNWMFSQLPVYQRQGAKAYKKDLSNTILLADYLKNPEKKFKSVHVGGTNGKGSTSHMMASVFQEAGYNVGLYTSPHLKDFRERIRINGKKIKKNYVKEFVNSHKEFFTDNQCSFFEMTVGLAFQYFVDKKVDIAIIEVGLGGRLDSTNIIIPELSVITNIGLDHTQFLGNDVVTIAKEKAGIIKEQIPSVIGFMNPEVEEVFKVVADQKESELFIARKYNGREVKTALKGDYQKENVKTVLQSIEVLKNKGWKLTEESIKKGLLNVVENTKLLGRWQVLKNEPKVICDTGHNVEGLKYTLKQLQEEEFEQLHIVLGVVNDKKLDDILTLFPHDAQYYFAKPDIPRGLDALELKKNGKKFQLNGDDYKTVKKAYGAALQNATKRDVVYVGGSTFVVAEII